MDYIYGLIVLALLFGVLNYFTGLSGGQKIMVFVVIGAMVGLAYLYNQNTKNQQRTILANVQAFEIGKTLTCNKRDVNSTNYTLSVGTYTFMGKKHTPYYGDMISASSCK